MKRVHENVSIIGVPTEIGTDKSGTCLGPRTLRVNGLAKKLSSLGYRVRDRGDLAVLPESADSRPGIEKLQVALDQYQAVKEHVYQELRNKRLPLILGGDHSLSIGSIAAVAGYCAETSQELCVLWFDAHADFNTFESSPSGNLHGMPVATLAGLGHTDLLSLGHQVPLVKQQNIYQVGIRSVDPAEKQLLFNSDVQVYDMRLIDETGIGRLMNRILHEVTAKQAFLHVSFDIDCLDPQIAPGTGTTSPGGLKYREAQLCMEMIHDSGLMRSLEIVEFNPLKDVSNQTGIVAVELIESLFGKEILSQQHYPTLDEVSYGHANCVN